MTKRDLDALFASKHRLLRASVHLKNFSKHRIPVLGYFRTKLQHHGKRAFVTFSVTAQGTSLLGLDAIQQLGLLIDGATLTCRLATPVFSQLPADVPPGFEHLPGRAMRRQHIVPVSAKLRRLPLALRQQGASELRRLEDDDGRGMTKNTPDMLQPADAVLSVCRVQSPVTGSDPYTRLKIPLTANSYVDIIEQVLVPFLLDGPFPDGLFVFQHDRSPIHTANGAAQTSPRTFSAQPSPDVDHWPPVSNHRGLPGANRTSSGTRYSQPSADANKDLSVSSHRNHRGSSRTPPSKNCSLTSPGTSRGSPVTNSRHLHEGGTQTTPSLGRRYPTRKNPARDKAAN
ncbi:hypothetical protein HPB52_006351 [Rhipicephalus sanguineus]|uniref:Uncharacterized protein n=1 Tax=Rhipicephalus sanguineus TaxID=34632 RepID=A0A9D4SXU3_RHISA|nr:hypothetical protein HPB52_006351 [Rhipicephalus sanguineus]